MFGINDVRRMKKRGFATTETKVVVDTSRMSTRMRNLLIAGVRDLAMTRAGWDTRKVMLALLKHVDSDLPVIMASRGPYAWASVPSVRKSEQWVEEALFNTIATAQRMTGKHASGRYPQGDGAWAMDVSGVPFADIVAETWTKPLLLTEKRRAEVERVVKLLQDGIRVEYTTTDI